MNCSKCLNKFPETGKQRAAGLSPRGRWRTKNAFVPALGAYFVPAALTVTLAAILTTGCKKDAPAAAENKPAAAASSALPTGLILTEAPKNPLDIITAKKTLKAGDDIVVRGRIGGRKEPFVESRAIFQLVDASVPICSDKAMCDTPWDYCCEPKDNVTAKSITVQIVGPNGKPLQADVKGQGGLKPAAKIIVRGKVEQKPDEKVMIVRADGIYVERS